MNRKQALTLFMVFFILTLAGIVFFVKDSFDTRTGKMEDESAFLGNFDVNSVAKLKIKSPEKSLTLELKGGKWVIPEKNDYPADFKQLSSFVQVVRNVVPARELLYGKEYWERFKLLPPQAKKGGGTLVEIFDKDGRLLSSFLAGKMHFTKEKNPNPYMKTSYPDGRYVLVNSKQPFAALLPVPLEVATSEPIVWMQKETFSIGPIESISSYGPKGGLLWTLFRASPKAPLDFSTGKQKAEQETVKQFAALLHETPFIDALPLKKLLPLINILGVIKVKTFAGIIYEFKIGVKGRRYYLKLDAVSVDNSKASEEKLKAENFYSNWIYEITPKLAEVFMFKKEAFLKKK